MKRGVRYVRFAQLIKSNEGTPSESWSYGEVIDLGKTAALNATVNKAEGKDYGDDELADYESQVTSYSLTWESQRAGLDISEKLLGHEKDMNGVVHSNQNDVAPMFGCSAITMAANKWVAKFYPCTKWSDPDDSNTTTTDSIEFGHSMLQGEAMPSLDGDFKLEKSFPLGSDGLAAAQAWITSCFNSVPSPSIVLSDATATIAVNGTKTLTATTVPDDATVTWISADESKATVTSGGVVEGVEATAANTPVAIIAMITAGGTTYTAKCDVTVTAA